MLTPNNLTLHKIVYARRGSSPILIAAGEFRDGTQFRVPNLANIFLVFFSQTSHVRTFRAVGRWANL
jgi:hypothetical protein